MCPAMISGRVPPGLPCVANTGTAAPKCALLWSSLGAAPTTAAHGSLIEERQGIAVTGHLSRPWQQV